MHGLHKWIRDTVISFLLLCSCLMAQADDTPEMILAKTLPESVDVSQYWVSEKYDGVRGYWNGQKRQMYSRNGQVIALPQWLASQLPNVSLDGELWAGRGQFEKAVAIVRDAQPDDQAWRQIRYMVFELPDHEQEFGDFSQRIKKLEHILKPIRSDNIMPVKQWRVKNRIELSKQLDEMTRAGAEGLMLHLASAPYQTGRSDALYKLKLKQDAEATIIGYVAGTGKYAGMVGSLRVKTADDRIFQVGSGLTDELRQNPPPVGTVITYQFNGLTRTGLPRFPRFLRIRQDMGL